MLKQELYPKISEVKVSFQAQGHKAIAKEEECISDAAIGKKVEKQQP